MKKHKKSKVSNAPKENFQNNLGSGGDRFQPSSFGDSRGVEQSWVSKLPDPPKSA